jgi:hypothetical protein
MAQGGGSLRILQSWGQVFTICGVLVVVLLYQMRHTDKQAAPQGHRRFAVIAKQAH